MSRPSASSCSNKAAGYSFVDDLASRVIGEVSKRPGYEYAETWELIDYEGPKKVTVEDPNLGPNQQRYQLRFQDFTGTFEEISVNYDPDTGNIGIVKRASGK